MTQRSLLLCGLIAPLLFIGIVILGGAIRPGYSHLSDTISELFSPGSPNKALLDPLHTLYAILLVLFGIGILLYVRGYEQAKWVGVTGAGLYIAMGLLSATSATIFPQDARGAQPTFAGEMHMVVHGGLSILTMCSLLLIGIWFARAKGQSGFRTYSFITVGLAILSAGLFMVTLQEGSPLLGLFERIAGLIGFQWTFVLALRLLTFLRLDNQ
jgi:uncharacterized membrane protein